jgi:hypothetical protein
MLRLVLVGVGADRLRATLGEPAYNAIVVMGVLNLLALCFFLMVIWLPLFGFGYFATWLITRTAARLSSKRRALVALGGSVLIAAVVQFTLLDGWFGTLVDLTSAGDDTSSAADYSALGFWSVRAGMTQQRVLECVGEPLERYPIPNKPDMMGWRWTRSPHDMDYRVRVILFRNGVVGRKISEHYFD